MPTFARASATSGSLSGTVSSGSSQSSGNLQTMPLLQAANNLDPAPSTAAGDVAVVDGTALVSQEGPDGTLADIVKPANGTISTYVVQPGDTLSGIAQMFGVTTGTILSANDLSRNAVLQPGEQLVILPITGITYTVKKGDTVESIAQALQASSVPPQTASSPTPSSQILQGWAASGAVIPFANNPDEPVRGIGPVGTPAQIAYYMSPLPGPARKNTQNIHGYNAVDIGAPTGTPIIAAADGTVIVAKSGGWNGGYGSYVVIQHDNGSQTLYAHMSKVAATPGESVVQGQVIGYVGETGDATGPHVHFEIRNGIRNPF